jgi:hypothetical protein
MKLSLVTSKESLGFSFSGHFVSVCCRPEAVTHKTSFATYLAQSSKCGSLEQTESIWLVHRRYEDSVSSGKIGFSLTECLAPVSWTDMKALLEMLPK